jgi:hypothetical protein
MDAKVQVAELKPARGAGWLAEAFALFRRKPFAWIGLCTGWLLITFAVVQLPAVGLAISSFLQPVFFASFAIAAFRQVAGEPVMMGDLFSGFRRNVRALVQLGAIMLIAHLLIIFIVWALLGMPRPPAEGSMTFPEFLDSIKGKEWALFVFFVLSAAVKGALWFAPPLIAFHDMGTSQAMRWSVYAAISNLGAMVVYGFALMGAMFVAMIPWGLGLVVVIPVMVISTFIGYREVFGAQPAPPSSQAP